MQRSRKQCSVRVWTVAAFTLSGCVPGVPHFVTAAESRAGHPYEDAEYGSADLALQAGYCDQSHLINEFQALCGCTPAEFRREAVSGSSKTVA